MLVAAIAKHLADRLAALAFDEAGATGNVFVAHMPSTPDVAVMLTPTGGSPNLTLDASDEATFQVMVRGAPHDARGSFEFAVEIYGELAGLDLERLDEGGPDEVLVLSCSPLQGGPVSIGQDDNQRPEWTTNWVVSHHAPTLHRS
jgi:hypothetical protein